MRGKVLKYFFAIYWIGITPAHAGKSTSNDNPIAKYRDHPRACGEKAAGGGGVTLAEGSPPRMRGKGKQCKFIYHIPGITPAHAGKSSTPQANVYGSGDHPRACGEKVNAMDDARLALGSPPRMRGKEALGRVRAFLPGITPAHAGKSASRYFMHIA